jgi:DNA modification methylase
MELNRIYNQDCLIGMKEIPNNSMDSIVTDPPYELGFMGKKWDSTGIAYNVDLWREALRVLKPGGHLLAFGGTRTYHRMTCAIEDAGFEIRDCIQWIYGSGFPKSMDISKAIDKAAGAEREVVGSKGQTGKNSTIRRSAQVVQGYRPDGQEYAGLQLDYIPITAPATDAAKQWEGWGTALKPANEPIVVARKPISGTVAENVLQWGTGGINIDDCRIESDGEIIQQSGELQDMARSTINSGYDRKNKTMFRTGKPKERSGPANSQGRFPANVIFDEEAAEMLDRQSGTLKSGDNCVRRQEGYFMEHGGLGKAGDIQTTYGDSGGASRFFYCAKASQSERGEGNKHPTVKPIKLIKYLVTLVTPKGGTSLDPFEGSGTHGKACEELGFNYIGFESDEENYAIACNRIKSEQAQIRMAL